jgi:uncharacterized protein YdhG (YjbR/CyaY superfamily)
MMTGKPTTIDEYIAGFPESTQQILKQLRTTIRNAAPEAQETISYAIPTFTQQGALVYFAAFKNHIGLYALPTGHAAFRDELSVYKQGKGSVQFPLEQPLPLDLITRIVKFRLQENVEKAGLKKK